MTLVSRLEAKGEDAPVIVLFGGNPLRRHEVLEALRALGDVMAIGALSEDEGMELLRTLPRVDVVLIGGRYSEEQRQRIRAYVREQLPGVSTTEPGWDYPYENSEILAQVRRHVDAARQRRALA